MTPEPDNVILSEETGRQRLLHGAAWLTDRLRYYPRSTPDVLRGIRFGVVFVVAWWGGPSRSWWAGLIKTIQKHDPGGRLEVVVLDINGMSDFEPHVLGPTVAGSGETAWVKDRVPVVPKWVFGSDAILVNTRLFLEGRELFVPGYPGWTPEAG